jgi:ATP-dependent RNA helicase DDX55/SPB4
MYEPVNSLKFYSIHGKMVPKRRNAVYSNFQSSPSGTVLLCTDLIARGLDMPDIDWVVQFDPPQDPKAFAHRCGRTARIGRNGKAVVFLMPSEDAYVEFLKIRNIPIVPLSLKNEDEHCTDMPTKEELIQWQKECSKSDRDVFEKSVKGFVSWVRSYKEHEANYIFQIKNVNLGKLALLMGIIRMPKMPEITRGEPVEFANEEIDVSVCKSDKFNCI